MHQRISRTSRSENDDVDSIMANATRLGTLRTAASLVNNAQAKSNIETICSLWNSRVPNSQSAGNITRFTSIQAQNAIRVACISQIARSSFDRIPLFAFVLVFDIVPRGLVMASESV